MIRLLRAWNNLHRSHWLSRAITKIAAFLVVLLLVLYPRVWLVPICIERWCNINAALDADEPRLDPLEQEVRRALTDVSEADLLTTVEAVVYDHIPYAFDWETWGVMDYVPTVGEALAAGREDCDGRAVVAASLLRRLGYDAWVVSDLKHAWVVTRPPGVPDSEIQELMSPGEGAHTLGADAPGTTSLISAAAVANLGRALAFGVAVFPLGRELIVLSAIVVLTLHPRVGRGRAAIGIVLLFAALFPLRNSGAVAQRLADQPVLVGLGVAFAIVGWGLLAWRGSGRPTTATISDKSR